MTGKLQVTVPKAIAKQYGINPGDEVEFQPAGETIRFVPKGRLAPGRFTLAQRLLLFDEATARQEARQRAQAESPAMENRGWRREDLYTRGSTG